MILASSGQDVPITVTIPDGSTNLYPRARIYAMADDTLVATVDLTHQNLGTYKNTWTVAGTTKYYVNITIYSDAGHTTVAPNYGAAEEVIVSDAGSGDPAATVAAAVWDEVLTNSGTADGTYGSIAKVLAGWAGANAVYDNPVFDSNGLMTSVRLRVFANNAAATAATDGGTGEGEMFTVTLTASADETYAGLPDFIKGLVT